MAAGACGGVEGLSTERLGELIVAKVLRTSQRTDLSIRQAMKTGDNTLGGFWCRIIWTRKLST